MRIFEALTVKTTEFRNRIVMPPMASNMGIGSDQAIAYYGARARGGVGTVIVEGTNVLRFDSEQFRDGAAKLAETISGHGAIPVIQLVVGSTWDGRNVAINAALGDSDFLSDSDIENMALAFGRAAQLAEECGFRGAEVHGAHHFFFNQFFSPIHNHRRGRYGGTLEGRMNFGLDAVKAIRSHTGPDFLVYYRHTPVWLDDDGRGYGLEETTAFVKALVSVGLDIIDISPSRPQGGRVGEWAEAVKKAVSLPVIAVGGLNDPAVANRAVDDGSCDFVAVGRGLIADAAWSHKVAAGQQDDIIRCIECNVACYGYLRNGRPIGCTQNPLSGQEFKALAE